MRYLSVVLVAAVALSAPADAQSCHSLTGNWAFDPAASRVGSGLSFNPFYKIDTIDLAIEQRASSIAQSWHLKGAHIDETNRFETPADGRSAPTGLQSLLNTMPLEVRGHWENCTLVEQARTNLFGQAIWTESRFVVSPDDQHLTIQQVSHSDLGDVERALVFDRKTKGAAR